MDRQIERPRPNRFSLDVKNGSNTRSRSSSGMPRALVRNRHTRESIGHEHRHDGHPPLVGRGRRHGIARVEYQVEQDLLQLHAIAAHLRQRRRQLRRDRHSTPDQIAVNQVEHFLDDHVDVEGLRLRRSRPHQRTHPMYHLARTAACRNDVAKHVAHLCDVRRRQAEQAQPRLRVGDDRRQRLVQLVRQGPREFADRHDAAGVRKFLSKSKGLELRHLDTGHVGMRDHRATLGPLQRFRRQSEPEDLAAAPATRTPIETAGASRSGRPRSRGAPSPPSRPIPPAARRQTSR